MAITFINSFIHSPIVPGAVLWLDAADVSTITVATGVSQWDDKSGNGNHAIQAVGSKQPAYISGEKLTFDGSNDTLDLQGSASLNLTESMTIFIVAGIASDASIAYVLCRNGSGSTENQYAVLFNDSTVKIDYIMDGSSARDTNSVSTGEDVVISAIYDQSTAQVFINGSSDGGNSFTGTLTERSNMFIGARSANSDGTSQATYFKGSINEIIIYPTALVDEQRQAVESYLRGKWGI